MRYTARVTRVHRDSRHGGAAIELALVMPAMIALVLGCIDFGRFAYAYIAVSNAANAAASFAIGNPPSTSTMARWTADVQQAAANEVGSLPGFTASSVVVGRISDAGGLYRDRINVPCHFKTVFYWGWLGIPTTINMQFVSVMREIRP